MSNDPWKHLNSGMRCGTCMWFVRKEKKVNTLLVANDPGYTSKVCEEDGLIMGRCRRHAPAMNGYPVVFENDWCGDHKLDENKV